MIIKMIKNIFKWLGIIFLSIVLLIAIYTAFNFTYVKRIVTSIGVEQVRSIDWYEPTVEVLPTQQAAALDLIPNDNDAMHDKYADALQYAQDTNSSAFIIWQGGELVMDKYWAPYNKESYTQTHSIHKSLLSMLVGIAVEDGDIASVDDNASKYIGNWVEQPLGQITIKNLLTMTSGLGKEPAKVFLFSQFLRLLNGTDISAVAQSLPQKIAPSTEFEYINTNPQLLVDVLESATGQQYETYLQDKIWSKMAASPGYLWMDREDGTPHGYCCLIAKPEDLLRIGLLVLNKGKINGEQVVPKSWIEKATQPSINNPNYGYLMWRGTPYTKNRKYVASSKFSILHSEPYIADDVIYFDGFGGQRIYIVPSRDLIIVRVGETRMDFDDAILPNRVISAIDADIDATQKTSKKTPHKIGMLDSTIHTEHNEKLNVRVTYPVDVSGDLPLIVFSHGSFLTADTYHQLTDNWVSQGYIVANPTHLDTGGFKAGMKAQKKYGNDWLTASRVLDMKATADQVSSILLQAEGFEGNVINNNYIAAGHSYGALSAQILGGATLQRQGDASRKIPKSLNDNRVSAVIAFSPPGTMGERLTAQAWTELNTPQLVITGTKDVLPPFWPDYKMHQISYESAQPGNNYLLVLKDVDHYFGNLIGRLDKQEDPKTQALQNASSISLHFAQIYLNNNTQQITDFADIELSSFSEVAKFEHR